MTIQLDRTRLTRAALTLACIGGFAWSVSAPAPAAATESSPCANGRCEGATLCMYQPGESCAFTDRRTCVTYRCPRAGAT